MLFPRFNRTNSRKYLELGIKALLVFALMVLFFVAFVNARQENDALRTLRKQAKDQESLGKAISYLSVKDNTQAKEQLQNALLINPGNIHAAVVLSKLSAANKGAVLVEIERIKMVTGSRPDYWAAWVRLSYLYDEIGEVDLAKEAKQKAASLAF